MTVPVRRLLLAAAALAIGVAAVTGAAPAPVSGRATVGDCTPGSDWGTVRADLVDRVLTLVNADRAKVGLGSLTTSTTLTNSAVWKARHMARYRYKPHPNPAPPPAHSPPA